MGVNKRGGNQIEIEWEIGNENCLKSKGNKEIRR